MNLQGITAKGINIETAETYNSIAGCSLYMDGRFRVTQTGGQVSMWGDRSPQANSFFQNREVSKPSNVSNLWIDSTATTAQGEYVISNRRDYRFLHNGNPMAVYALIKWNVYSTGATILITKNNNVGFRLLLSSSTNGRIIADAYNGNVAIRQPILANLKNFYANEENIIIVRHIFYGANITNNQVLQYGTQTLTNTDTSPIGDYATGDSDLFTIAAQPVIGDSLKTGILLAYDWTGYNTAQINAFDARVMDLLNQDKITFETLDA